ncbi:arylamine N-acetyltransferase [Kocuria rhizophila]|nr:arylamine N-acetyltransferase [Kocuria rhizophila]
MEVLLGHYPGTVFDQLVVRRRGGYCFERAQLFAAALETAGFTVRRALGRVRSLQSARTHMTVLVDLAGVRYLCDPGSGFSIAGPVPLQDGARHVDTVRPSPWAGSTIWGVSLSEREAEQPTAVVQSLRNQ